MDRETNDPPLKYKGVLWMEFWNCHHRAKAQTSERSRQAFGEIDVEIFFCRRGISYEKRDLMMIVWRWI